MEYSTEERIVAIQSDFRNENKQMLFLTPPIKVPDAKTVCPKDFVSQDILAITLLRGSKVISPKYLPARAPVMDFIATTVANQHDWAAGGSHMNTISATIEKVKRHKFTRLWDQPDVMTITLGESSTSEVDFFTRSLLSAIESNTKSHTFALPLKFFTFHIEYLNLEDDRLPSRLVFGVWNRRFDVFIPWEQDEEGWDFSIDGILSSAWCSLFKIPACAVGIDIQDDLDNLQELLDNLEFHCPFDKIGFRSISLPTLLALVGYNSDFDYQSLAYVFTGYTFYDVLSSKLNFTRLHSVELQAYLSNYIQAKVHTVFNALACSIMCYTLGYFPTPGIALVVTKKSSRSFFNWQMAFLGKILENAFLDPSVFSNPVDSPAQRLQKIIWKEPSPFTSDELVKAFPSWNSICGGGCPTDALAIMHLMQNFAPMLNKNNVPKHLHWYSSSELVLGVFGNPTGQPCGSLKTDTSINCNYDSSVPPLPVTVDPQGSTRVVTICQEFVEKLHNSSPIKKLTNNQLMLLYLWRNLYEAKNLYCVQIGADYFLDQGDNVGFTFFQNQNLTMVDNLTSYRIFDSCTSKTKTIKLLKKRKNSLEYLEDKIGETGVVSQRTNTKIQRLRKFVKKAEARDLSLPQPKRTKPSTSDTSPTPGPSSSMPDNDPLTLEVLTPNLSAEQLMSSDFF